MGIAVWLRRAPLRVLLRPDQQRPTVSLRYCRISGSRCGRGHRGLFSAWLRAVRRAGKTAAPMPRRCAQTCDNTLENMGSTIVDIRHRCCIFLRVATDVVERRSPSEGAITPAAAASPEASIPPLPIRSPCRVGLLTGTPPRSRPAMVLSSLGAPGSMLSAGWRRGAPTAPWPTIRAGGISRRGAGIKDAICATRLCCPFGAAGIRRAGQFLLAAAGAWASGAPRHRQAARGRGACASLQEFPEPPECQPEQHRADRRERGELRPDHRKPGAAEQD